MVKKIILSIFCIATLNASSYAENCLKCHVSDFKLSMFMQKYTLKYSSEKRIKKAIFSYLKNPTVEKSVLPFGYLKKFGVKEKSKLEEKVLREMIDIYYEKHNIKSKIH